MELIDKKIAKIHNYIYANEGLSNSEVLNEFLKIFYCKILDEQDKNELTTCLSSNDILEKIWFLYGKFKELLKEIVDHREKINLKKETIVYVVNELRDIEFKSITSDVKGHLLQKIIDRSYRESRGQFFTPAPVVDFMVRMINPSKGELGCDPASGTGGFMFTALEYISKNNKITKNDINNVYFYDISKSLIKLIAMRMMFEFSYNESNFDVRDSIAEDYNLNFDYVLTNPPFGTQGKILDPKILKKYQLGLDEKNKVLKSQTPDLLFVEKVIKILKENGRAAIVLPDGDFENPSQKYFRKYIINNVKIDAIISLPDGTFTPYGTGIKSSIIIFTKVGYKKLQQLIDNNYEVFYGKITKLGYSFSKHSKNLVLPNGKIDEDYSKIINSYYNKEYNDNAYMVKIGEIIEHKYILSESFYSPIYKRNIEKLKQKKCLPLKELVEFNYNKIKIEKDRIYNYIEIADINSYTNEIINCTEMLGENLPSRASYKLDEGDLVVAVSGNAIGTKKQSKAMVNKNYKNCICTNGLTVMKATKISPYYLLHFFNSESFFKQVLKFKYGTAIPCIGREDFENILVPILEVEETTKIENKIKRAIELRDEAIKLLQN